MTPLFSDGYKHDRSVFCQCRTQAGTTVAPSKSEASWSEKLCPSLLVSNSILGLFKLISNICTFCVYVHIFFISVYFIPSTLKVAVINP